MKPKLLPLLAVAIVLSLAIGLIAASLFANRLRWERETALAAAKHDGAAILADLAGAPATAAGIPEMERGPLRSDLANGREAWIVWRQDFVADGEFTAVVDWHLGKLRPLGWIAETEDPDKTIFQKENWRLSLHRPTDGRPVRFQRELVWKTDGTTL